jgi:hypothetical protein
VAGILRISAAQCGPLAALRLQLRLGNGETIAGVGSAALSAGNFLFNQEPTTTNAGTMTIADGAMLPLGGTIDNSGTIALASTGAGAELEVRVRGVTYIFHRPYQ